MTSRTFDITQEVINRIRELNVNIKNADIDISSIDANLQSLMNGNGIKILNAIDELSTGYFIFYNSKGFFIVHDEQGLAKKMFISNDRAFEILSLYYSCRALSRVPKYYDREIISRIKTLVTKVQE
jgi:hypothetical protein